MGEHSESGQFNMQLSSEPSSAEAQKRQQNELGASAPMHSEPCVINAYTVATHSFLNGYAVHIRRREEGRCGDSHKKVNNYSFENNTSQENSSHKELNVECDNDDSCLGSVDVNNNYDDGNDDGSGDHEDGDGNDRGDDVGDSDSDSDGGHDDDDDGDGKLKGDDDDGNYDYNDDNGNNDSYDDDDDDDDDDDEKDHENSDSEGYYGKEAHYSPKTDMSHVSNHNPKTQTQSHGLPDSSSRDEVMRKTESTTSRSNKTDDEKLKVEGGRTAYTSNLKPEALPSGSNAIHLSQGAKPKTSSQRVLLLSGVDPGFLSNGRIPSLEIIGIRQDFLARHTTDVSLPYESYPGECDFPIELTPWANRRHASASSNDHSYISRSLPLPPDREMRTSRHHGPGYSDVQRAHSGYQPTSPVMSLRSDWQLPYEPQTERNSPFTRLEGQWWSNPPDPWVVNQQQSQAHRLHLGNFSSATWPRVGNSSNRHAWMPGSNECSWCSPSINLYSSKIGTAASARNQPALTLPAVRSRAPAVILPSVTTADTQPQPSSNLISQSVAPNRFSSNALCGFHGNGQERLSNSSRLRQNNRENQENNRVNSSDMVPSRREEVRSGESGSQALPAPETLEQGSFTPNATEDYTLAALERKVAEACAVVERVMKEREERTKAQREAAQRERERRERVEREERERREREEREIRQREAREREEREAREREEREKREREAKERESREVRERDATEQRENEEQGGREGERRVAGERTPVQESRRWQCQHYQRRCSVSFPCCGIFYPCHRCHNGSGACDADDIKANQATRVKCGNCGHEEEINERSQHCSSCGTKFSEYFCFKCKHFTGVEKNPFHCNKCGICRIYKDKSFHCDVCNVCLDKRLEGKHKCRPDSGHDECCICLEDAFSGCQILPCSHKVHKECAIAMIQNGVRNCPICRQPLFNQGSR